MLTQRAALLALTLLLVVLGIWILRPFLAALAWAVILAIATWPLYGRFVRMFPPPRRKTALAPASFGVLVGLVLLVPLAIVAVAVGREGMIVARSAVAAAKTGIALPDQIGHLPFIGQSLGDWWESNLSDPHTSAELFDLVDTSLLLQWTHSLGTQLLHRSVVLAFTLLILFFLYRDGLGLARRVVVLATRAFGPAGEHLASQMVAAVQGTVNGLILVGLAEGVILGVAYALAGLPHSILLGAVTGILAVIPFGAPIIFGGAALILVAQSQFVAAAALFGVGLAVVIIADHFVRPVLIGNAARLPFVWVLLGILGGLESFGVVGLFLGPAIMAALMALWREWLAEPRPAPP